MLQDGTALKKSLVILGAAALFTLGLGIVIYVTIARDRIAPKRTTPSVVQITATSMPAPATVLPISSPDPTSTAEPSASVVGVVTAYEPGALIIVLLPTEGTADQVIVPENLTVTWADGSRASPREIATGQTLFAEGELDTLGRLIASRIVITELAKASVTPTPAPTVTAAPSDTPWLGWLGEYFDNPRLDGPPLFTRNDATLDFTWGEDAPLPLMPYDGFSVRWRGAWDFEEGSHRFYAFTDDGVRVYVDGELVIDQWRNQAPTLAYGDRYLSAGAHDVTVEFFDGVLNAQIRVWWDFQGAYPDWRGEYYDNRNLAGEAVLLRNDADVAFDWDGFSPGKGVPADNFSARWLRTITFDEGAYTFHAVADDGVRVWVDGIPVISEWHENDNQTYNAPIWLEQGDHEVRVEYLEMGGDARVRVWWDLAKTFAHWRGAYYANPDLAGRPAWVRDDEQIAFDWGDGGPGHNLPNDNFSVRWSRTVDLKAGTYRFYAYADDGLRVSLDGQVIIDQWRDSPAEEMELFLALSAGKHELVVDYYERGDQAVVRAGWSVAGTPTPTVTWTALPTATAAPTQTVAPTREIIEIPTATSQPTSTGAPTATPEPPTATPGNTTEPTPGATAEPTPTGGAYPTPGVV